MPGERMFLRHVIVAMMLVVLLFGCSVQSQKVLLIPREASPSSEMMLKNEVLVMVNILEEAGFKVDIASVSGRPFSAADFKVRSDKKVSKVNLDRYVGIIMACMAVGDIPVPPEVVDILKRAYDRGIPIAAQNGAVKSLSEAGILEGKRYAFFIARYFPEGIFEGFGVVQDGKIVTSGSCPFTAMMNELMPDTTAELTQTFVRLLNDSSTR
jgi:putative intracellular protease/amidase